MTTRSLVLATLGLIAVTSTLCKAADPEPREPGWFNETELSVVGNRGNKVNQTYGLKESLTRVWVKARFRFKFDFVAADKADDRYLLVEPGITFLPGEQPTGFSSQLVSPGLESDFEKYFAEARYDREISKRFYWNAGVSWDRNADAGILNRYIGFAGLGNFWESQDMKFSTTYALSYTDREEDQPDPDKEDQFTGVRLGWDYRLKLGDATAFTNEFTSNISTKDSSDYSLDMTNALSVSIGKHVSLKVSLQWLYNNEPALVDVDVIARVDLIDPDGIPGNGDEYFVTISDGGTEITLSEDQVRKERLDTVFRTTLVMNF